MNGTTARAQNKDSADNNIDSAICMFLNSNVPRCTRSHVTTLSGITLNVLPGGDEELEKAKVEREFALSVNLSTKYEAFRKPGGGRWQRGKR